MLVFGNQKSSNIIHQLQKELDETREELIQTQKALKEAHKSKESLDSFLAWMQEICAEKNWQFMGVYKIKSKLKNKEDYVGFAIFKNNCEWNEVRTQFFTIHGYLCNGSRNIQKPCYEAHLQQYLSEIPNITNTLGIVDHYIEDPSNRRRGIGSSAVIVMKNLAKELHCSAIKGKRHSETPRDDENLQKFYNKHHFHQENNNKQICFDMTEYKCKLPDHFSNEDMELPMTPEELETERMVLLSSRLIRTRKYDQLISVLQDEKHRDALMREMRIIKD